MARWIATAKFLPLFFVSCSFACCGSPIPAAHQVAVPARSGGNKAEGVEATNSIAAPSLVPESNKVEGAPVAPAATPAAVLANDESSWETLPSGLIVNTMELGGPLPAPKLPEGTRVLHVGDSFAGALGIELNKVLSNAGIKTRLEFEKSTYIPTWANGQKLSRLVSDFKPDLVLISLGANELENPQPENRAPLIQKLVKAVGSTPCVWIAPVLWSGAKSALLDVIRANVGQCVYLDSNLVIRNMPRAGDKIHPSMGARPDWAVAMGRWLAYHRKPTDQYPWTIAVRAQ
ncbi:MAG TPA: SGNH/GDSL hydrolase family protein [Polyangiaceae bacterium]